MIFYIIKIRYGVILKIIRLKILMYVIGVIIMYGDLFKILNFKIKNEYIFIKTFINIK